MKLRLITAFAGITVFFVVLMFYNTIYFNIVVAVFACMALTEVYVAFAYKSLTILFGMYAIGAAVILSDFDTMRRFMVPFLFIVVICLVVYVLSDIKKHDINRIGGMLLYASIILFCFYSFVHFKLLLPIYYFKNDALFMVMLCCAYGWCGDTAAYFAGITFGKKKLAPRISPNKTVEGAIGGILGASISGVILTVIFVEVSAFLNTPTHIPTDPYLLWLLLIFGIIGGILGVLGDLFASAIKRQCNVKDFGAFFPGHGGVLDRFDSVLLIAPFVVLVVNWILFIL